MKKKIMGLLSVGLLVGPIAANAVSVSTTSCGQDSENSCVSGISGLAFNGAVFDVSFVYGTIAVYPSPIPFFNDATTAQAAAAAMIDAARGAGADGGFAWGPGAPNPATRNGFMYFGPSGHIMADIPDQKSLISNVNLAPYTTYLIVFRPTSVPEPGTLVLLGLGLAGLGLSRRRNAN